MMMEDTGIFEPTPIGLRTFDLLSDPQLGAASAGIQINFILGRRYWPPGNFQDTRFMPAGADRLAGRADAIPAFQAEEFFYNPVFQ